MKSKSCDVTFNNLLRDDRSKEKEVSEGFFEVRRRTLLLPLMATAMTSALSRESRADERSCSKQTGLMEWETFLKVCLPVARELHLDTSPSGQDAYLFTIASLSARLCRETIPRAQLGKFEPLDPPVEFGVGFRGVPFFVVEWRLAPMAVLPPHCHPNASVCTLSTGGDAFIQNFEVVGEVPDFASSATFRVRETRSEVLSPGRFNTLSSVRDNIHTFRAGKTGARGIDFSTYHGKDVGFSFLKIADKPQEAIERIYSAQWLKL